MPRIFTSLLVLTLGTGFAVRAFAQAVPATPPAGAPPPAVSPPPASEVAPPAVSPAAPPAPEAAPPAAPLASEVAPVAAPPPPAAPSAPTADEPAAPAPPPAAEAQPERGKIRLAERRHARRVPRVDEEPENSPPTLLGKKVKVGGYGSVDVAYTRMFGKDGALIGLQGALLLDHRVSLGIAGYGWTNPQRGPDDPYGEGRRYESGYIGATFRYSFLQDSPVYLTAGGLVGSGIVVLAPDHHHDDSRDEHYDIRREDVDVFAVFQPDITLNANLTRWMRVGLTAGYRFTAGVSRFGMKEEDLNGAVVGGNLQFGRF